VTLKLFVVWDDEGGACVVAAQSAEHATTMIGKDMNDRHLPWPENIREIVVPEYAPGVLWVLETDDADG
jgi:hypothetical protein